MTTSRVGNVSKVTPVSTNASSKGTNVDATGFQKVWNARTDRNDYPQTANANAKSSKSGQAGVTKNSLHNKKMQQTDSTTSNKETEESSSIDTQQVLDLLQTITQQFLQQLSDKLNVSEEKVQQAMNELEINPTDLLSQDKLSQLLLHMNGVDDSMALLTNEQLYQQHQDAMQLREDTVNALTDVTAMDEHAILEVGTTLYDRTEVLDQQDVSKQEPQTVQDSESLTDKITEGQIQAENQAKVSEMSSEDTGSRQTGEHSRNEEPATSNLVLQSMKETAFTQQTEQIAEQPVSREPDTQDIMRQIMDYMKVQVKPGMSSLEMQLHPASLGTLQIQVASKGGVLTAQFVTQNESVKAALESQMVQLKENFAEQGIQVEAIEVTVQTHQFEQNLEQGRGRQQEQSSQTSKVRRTIRLDSMTDMEYADEMAVEDQLTLEMMEANGTTVDFTA